MSAPDGLPDLGVEPPDGTDDSGGGFSWADGVAALPESLRGSSCLEGHDSLEGFVKWADNANSLIGQKTVEKEVQVGIRPPDTEDLVDIRRYLTELGCPESAEGYDMADFEVKEGVPWDDGLQSKMLESAHRWGLRPEQAKGMFSDLIDVNEDQYKDAMGRLQGFEQEKWDILKKAWGDDYDKKRDLSGRAIRKGAELANVNVDDVIGMKTGAGTTFGDDATVNAVFAAMGEMMGEDLFHSGGTGSPAGNTPEQAQMRIKELAADPEFNDKLKSGRHPQHQDAMEQWTALHKEAAAGRGDNQEVDIDNMPELR